jgi:signal transduction histidine kinase
MFRSTSLRLAALYTGVFALAVVILGWIVVATTGAALTSEFDARIADEAAALIRSAGRGVDAVRVEVVARERSPGELEYGLQDRDGAPLVGRLAKLRAPYGWSTPRLPDKSDPDDRIRVLVLPLAGGERLLVGDDLDPVEDLDALILRRFAWALGGVVLLGAAGGYLFSRDVRGRLNAISGTAQAIIDGDLSRRIPVRGGNDDLDRLAGTLNRMLERISALMESLRQVSNDIAHDLRTPLTRMRQRLEALIADSDEGQRASLESAVDDLDAALDTFAALLRIAQIEGGARRAGFREVDLGDIARNVVDAFAPASQDSGHDLRMEVSGPSSIHGDRELLTQMIANLVENGIRHTPAGSRIVVRVDGPTLEVGDDGPGVPEADRARLFDRFYRPERSRATPGSGLGLALVAAVARLHDAGLELLDARPGLAVRVAFDRQPEPRRTAD